MSVSAALVDSVLELQLRDNFSIDDVMEAFALGLSLSSPSAAHRPSVLLDVSEPSEIKSMEDLRAFASFIASHLEELEARVSVLVDSDKSPRLDEARQFCDLAEREGFTAGCFFDRSASLKFLHGVTVG
ncbi:MAG: hypothetical protein ABJ308_01285 [Halieaceae bacterium]